MKVSWVSIIFILLISFNCFLVQDRFRLHLFSLYFNTVSLKFILKKVIDNNFNTFIKTHKIKIYLNFKLIYLFLFVLIL